MFQIGDNEIRLPICKKLSRDEKEYLNILRKGVDEDILYGIKWLKTSEAEDFLKVDEDDFEDEFVKTSLYEDLNILFSQNVSNSEKFISKFYNKGSKLGYGDIGRILPFMSSDRMALNNLNNHINGIVENVNQETGIGIKDTLLLGVTGVVAISALSETLLNVPYSPVRSNISISSRCDMIARTEYGRSINTGLLQAYSNSGVQEVNINTTGLPNVCDDCIDLEENNPYSLEEAMSLLPLHPQCACSYSPVFDSMENVGNPVIIDLT